MQKTKPNIMKIFLLNDREVSRRSSGELPGEELPVQYCTVAQREFLNREKIMRKTGQQCGKTISHVNKCNKQRQQQAEGREGCNVDNASRVWGRLNEFSHALSCSTRSDVVVVVVVLPLPIKGFPASFPRSR